MRHAALALLMLAPLGGFAQWNLNSDNSSTGSLAIGSADAGSYSYFEIRGPNSPFGIESKREIIFNFASAGDAVIRSYRGLSWDSYIDFMTSAYSNFGGSPSTRLHIDGNGFIGIGTETPFHNLEITDNAGTPSLGLRGAFDSKIVFETSDGADRFTIWSDMETNTLNDRLRFGANNTEDILTLKGDGMVGIGTNVPLNTLTVYKESDANLGIVTNAAGSAATLWFRINSLYKDAAIVYRNDGRLSFNLDNDGSNVDTNEYMTILPTGNVGIGTTAPDSKFTVKGAVHAEEVKVDLSVPGPDYVFEDNYQLSSLSDTDKYIRTHQHLPEIPSSEEMQTNGINLKEMNLLLLKKVEELTLHLIEQSKRIDNLESENKDLKKLLNRK